MKNLIEFFSETDFVLEEKKLYEQWLKKVIESEHKEIGEVRYIFHSDEDLLKINQDYLSHDTYTDIITFDYSEGNFISAEIYISIDRVRDNANNYDVALEDELRRVMVHGLLHCCGYGDSTEELKNEMRTIETEKMKLFHVEQN